MLSQFASGFITAIIIIVFVAPFIYLKWKKQKVKLIENYARFADLAEATNDFLYYYQLVPEKKYLYLSPSAENFFGKGSIEYAYMNPNVCYTDVHPDDYEILCKKVDGKLDYRKSIVQRWKNKNGEYSSFEEYAMPIYEDGTMVAIKGVLRNIDEKMALQQELEYRVHHDGLTGLYNREFFEQKNLELNEQVNIPVAIIICDLDELKYVNDNFGHKEGDILIKETAEILKNFSSDQLTVARIGGDEFAMMITNATEKETEELVQEILLKVDENNSSFSWNIKLSIGFAFSHNSKGNMNDVFLKADHKMYEAKLKRKQLLLIKD